MMDYKDSNKCFEVEKLMEYAKWSGKIPPIKFKSDWNVIIIPPFARAIVRFLVEKNGNQVSIYLDCYDALGIFGEPYWELYPDITGDNFRCSMNNTEDLLNAISERLDSE
jgi:hypothetical protein